jgi:hypothetical protein
MYSIEELKSFDIITKDVIKFKRGFYEEFSNFYVMKNPITDEKGLSYPTVEHFFQSRKSRDCDVWTKFSIIDSEYITAGESKKLGRSVTMREDWDIVKYDFMRDALKQKFLKNPELKEKLMSTEDKQIIEWTSWGDINWGMCDKRGAGANALGKLLMELREFIKYNNLQ